MPIQILANAEPYIVHVMYFFLNNFFLFCLGFLIVSVFTRSFKYTIISDSQFSPQETSSQSPLTTRF